MRLVTALPFILMWLGASSESEACEREKLSHAVAAIIATQSGDAQLVLSWQQQLRTWYLECPEQYSIQVPMLGVFSRLDMAILANDYEYVSGLERSVMLTEARAKKVTPLFHSAVAYAGVRIVQYLLDSGVDVNEKDQFGNSAFAATCNQTQGRSEVRRVLEARGLGGTCD